MNNERLGAAPSYHFPFFLYRTILILKMFMGNTIKQTIDEKDLGILGGTYRNPVDLF